MSEPKNIVLYTGRIHPEKGVHLLIAAFLRMMATGQRGWTLRILGPWTTAQGGGGADYREELLRQAAKAEGAIELLEPIFDETALVAHYREAALFAYPSLAERGETFGLAALEAMGAGCAPIVSALGCFTDFIRDGENGIVFNHRAADPVAELTEALLTLVQSPDRRARMRRAAWTTARNYTLRKIADELIDDFRSLIEPARALTTSVIA
jgi:glycosyltransferase involved in cell wall biosynthesis